MDIKSTKSKYKLRFKFIAWCICIATGCLISFSIMQFAKYDMENAVASDRYIESPAYLNSMADYANSVEYAFYGYSDEVKQSELRSYISSLRDSYFEEISEVLTKVNLDGDEDEYIEKFKEEFSALTAQSGQEYQVTQTEAVGEENQSQSDSLAYEGVDVTREYSSLPTLDEYTQKQIDSIQEKYAGLLANSESYIEGKYNSMKEQAQENLKRNENFFYAIEENGIVVQNNVPKKEKAPIAWIQELEANKDYSWNTLEVGLYREALENRSREVTNYSSDPWVPINDNASIYVGMSDSYYQQQTEKYEQAYKTYLFTVILFVVWIILFAGAFIWLMYTAGRSPRHDEVKITFMDSIYLDIGGILLLIIEFILLAMFMDGSVIPISNTLNPVRFIRDSAYVSIGIALVILWGMSVSRRIKRHENYTLVGRIMSRSKKPYNSKTLKSKSVKTVIGYLFGGIFMCLLIVGLGFLIGGVGVFIGIVFTSIYLASAIKYALKRAAALQEITQGVEHIKGGDLEYRIQKGGGAEFDEIAVGIEHIAEGLEAAVSREVKAERMKTELITNVSHDIKTPLTSILTYVDLLKKEGLSSANAPRYLEVLDMKSRRLKYLTDDLFEAAKASSGDMKVEMSRIELVQFMEQALGEMSDKIEASNLEFVSVPMKEKMFVYADGKLLWRVIGNVLENALKYAAEYSRVYIDFIKKDMSACIVVKNVSREALNISEEELMERFKRGDEARHTEGSGLGLSIARNFMDLMGGRFTIEIDGDLFKVEICFSTDAEQAED